MVLGVPIFKHFRVYPGQNMVMGIICAPVVLILAWEHFHYVVRAFFQTKTTFVTSCLLYWMTNPFQKGSTFSGKNMLLGNAQFQSHIEIKI